jgi:hypothetical protein
MITYVSVVSCQSICLALFIAALNNLTVKVGYVLNAYITAPIVKKVWAVLGPEFGSVMLVKVPSLCMHYTD